MSKKNKPQNTSQRSSRLLSVVGLMVVIIMIVGAFAPTASDTRTPPTATLGFIVMTVAPTATPKPTATAGTPSQLPAGPAIPPTATR